MVASRRTVTLAAADAALAADVALLRGCEQLPDDVVVEGWRYDVDSGRILRIVPS